MVTGIVCEFNPFHKGHKYLIDSVKRTENDAVICCMSGNFVQRGEFAVENKFKRAETALKNGADLIMELPTVYATLSAEGFCRAGVALIEKTGVAEQIAFGAENADINALSRIASMLNDKETQKKIALEMKSGVSFPQARSRVLESDLLNLPNNILAVEYLRHAALPCVAVKRIGGGHDSADFEYSSSAIRSKIALDDISSLKNCEKAVLAKLRVMSKDDFKETADVSEGLENRIFEAVKSAATLDELYGLIKTKRYTHSRIRRIILRAYLGITDIPKEPPYIRVLGFSEKGRALLSEMKKKAALPIVTRLADCDENTLPFFERECTYTDLYNLGYKKPLPCGTEQRSQIVI